jgi:hypothetical protein
MLKLDLLRIYFVKLNLFETRCKKERTLESDSLS